MDWGNELGNALLGQRFDSRYMSYYRPGSLTLLWPIRLMLYYNVHVLVPTTYVGT
jgi:hypothetical protein